MSEIGKDVVKKLQVAPEKTMKKWDIEHNLIGETLCEIKDMQNNRLSEIQSELKSIDQALWHIVEVLKERR